MHLAAYGSPAAGGEHARRIEPCPRPRGSWIDPTTGVAHPRRCGLLSCYACIRSQAFKTAGALALARPMYLITLTLAGETWPDVRRHMQRWRQILHRQGFVWEHAFHVEPNPAGDGLHVHLWWWGDPIRRSVLADAASRAGMGLHCDKRPAYVRPKEPNQLEHLPYGLKAVLNPPDDRSEVGPVARRYLEVNGGRLLHATRKFWRDAEGKPIAGMRRAQNAANAYARNHDPRVHRFVGAA